MMTVSWVTFKCALAVRVLDLSGDKLVSFCRLLCVEGTHQKHKDVTMRLCSFTVAAGGDRLAWR